MKDGEFKRVKHGQLPGDISKAGKIRLREGKPTTIMYGPSYVQRLNLNAVKSFQRDMINKGKTVQRRRNKTAVEQGLMDMEQA